MTPKRRKALKEIRDPRCTACPLYEGATHICVMGDGQYRLPVMVLGEAPGRTEDERGKPFQGRAGTLLRAELSSAGLPPNSLYFTNAAKCFPHGTPGKEEVSTCSALYLQKEIKLLKPNFIIALGSVALKASTWEASITEAAGKAHPCKLDSDAVVLATYHPAYILRMDKKRDEWRNHLETFSLFVNLDRGKFFEE